MGSPISRSHTVQRIVSHVKASGTRSGLLLPYRNLLLRFICSSLSDRGHRRGAYHYREVQD